MNRVRRSLRLTRCFGWQGKALRKPRHSMSGRAWTPANAQ